MAMRRLSVFNTVSLDGYFTDARGEMRWAEQSDPEWREFTAANASGNGVLLFGRVTYDLMIRFWPTPAAMQSMPDVATGMNRAQKIVFSRTLDKPTWNNTTVVKGDLAAQVRRLKGEAGADMVILGSGQIVAQLTASGLIDEYQIALAPVVLGAGRTMFEGVTTRPRLKRTQARTFANGAVFLRYEATT
jgi:dihydrofolate reductase